MRVARRVTVGLLMAALMTVFGAFSVGATVPEAVGNIPVSTGAGCGTGCSNGSAGVNRSTLQNPVYIGTDTNVSGVPSANPNVNGTLYRDGVFYGTGYGNNQLNLVDNSSVFNNGITLVYGAYIVYNEQIQGRNGSYNTTLVGPITQRPPNGTSTGEPTAFDFVSPFTSSGKIVVVLALP